MPSRFPVMLDIADKLCVVIGGGKVAARKVRDLCRIGAMVRVISPEVAPPIGELFEKDLVGWEPRSYKQGDLAGAFLCVAATGDREVNAEVQHEAAVRRVLINVVDDPEASDYHVPSFFEDGPLLVAVSTRGASPAVSRTLRRMIQAWVGGNLGPALEIVNRFREDVVKEKVRDPGDRVRFWEEAVNADLLEEVRTKGTAGLEQGLERALDKFLAGNE